MTACSRSASRRYPVRLVTNKSAMNDFVQAALVGIAERRVSPSSQHQEPGRPDEQSRATRHPQKNGKATVGIRRQPSEHAVIKGRHRR